MESTKNTLIDVVGIETFLLIEGVKQYVYKNNLSAISHLLDVHTIDWNKLIQVASEQSILPLLKVLRRNFEKEIPSPIVQRIDRISRKVNQKSKSLFDETIRLQKLFEEKSLKILPYKGPVFVTQFYPGVGMRQSSDIDFAIRREDLLKAKSIMQSEQYVESKGTMDEENIKKSRTYHMDYPWNYYEDGKLKYNVEFHWQPSHEVIKTPLIFEDIFEETSLIKRNQNEFYSFNKIQHALIAVIHHGHVDCWDRLKHLVDLALMLKSLNGEELKQLEVLCEDNKVKKSFQRGKELMNYIFSNQTIKYSQKVEQHAQAMLLGELKGNWSESTQKVKIFLSTLDSFKDKFLALVNLSLFKLRFRKSD